MLQRKGVFLLTVLVFLSFSLNAQQHKGDIVGKVVDSRTLEPMPGANVVVVEQSGVGTSTGVSGNFEIRNLDVGTYSLKVSVIGYATQVVTNVVVTTGRSSQVTVKMEETVISLEGVTVQANYFSRAEQMSPVSANVIDRSEVLRSPGGIQDVQRVAQNLPGVASSTDNINELIVRGGAPFENLTILDNMEIPSINHYSNMFNSAGPINMVNADMIEDVQFSSGGFPAQYGDKSASVMSLTVREGNREKAFASKTAMHMAGIGTLVEGGFADGKGSYIFSARNSLLEFIDKIVGLSKISLTAIPKYWDLQSKVAYDLGSSYSLSLNLLYGDSRINIEGDPKAKDELRRNTIDSSSVESLYPITKQYAAGLSLRHPLGKEGYSVLTLYSSGTSQDIHVREDFAVRARDANGEVSSANIVNTRTVFTMHSKESFLGAKYEVFYQIHPQHTLSFGGQVQTALQWDDESRIAADTSRFDLDRNGTFETGPVIVPNGVFDQTIGLADASKYYFFMSDRYLLTPQLSLTLGLRYDHFTYSGKGALAPRASLSYQLAPAVSTVTFAVGEYYQTHPFPYYGDRRQIGFNKTLPPMKSTHFVLGFDRQLDRGLKLSIETYYKKYKQVAVSEDFIYSENQTFWSDRILAVGERYSYGAEFFLEQKQVEDFYGTISVSLSKTRMKDPRLPQLVSGFPSEYDYPVIVTVLGGKVVKGVRDWLDAAPFYLKYPSYILPLSNEMEVSFKYRYQSGRPFTPMEYVTWKQDREGGVKWSQGAWVATNTVNGARYSNYSRFDFQWISRFYHGGHNINVFIAMMNIFNTKNVFFDNYRSDGTKETVYQFAFFPVGGVEVEF